VIHTVVEHIDDITPMLGLLQKEARRFGAPRADETLKSGAGSWRQHRERPKGGAPQRPSEPDLLDYQSSQPGEVMPKGRNFH
jgi:DNA polymerase-3 subunit alpha/error-prone DNA polymerase